MNDGATITEVSDNGCYRWRAHIVLPDGRLACSWWRRKQDAENSLLNADLCRQYRGPGQLSDDGPPICFTREEFIERNPLLPDAGMLYDLMIRAWRATPPVFAPLVDKITKRPED